MSRFRLPSVWWLAAVMAVAAGGARAQGQVHVTNHPPSEYGAGNQNWDIDTDGYRLHIANNFGLMVVDGQSAELYTLPGRTIVRSATHVGGRTYVGSFEEFGYWEADAAGEWTYTSLIPLSEGVRLNNDEFWRIIPFGNNIYFQSFGRILRYDASRVREVPVPGPMMFLHAANGRLFAQQIGGGLFELIENDLREVPGSRFLAGTEVKTVLPLGAREWLIGTSTRGVYRYDGVRFERWSPGTTVELERNQINTGARVGELVVFGTILKGLYLYKTDGTPVGHLHTGTGLLNNTILALQADERGNLWAGTDKGYAHIAFDSPVTVYRDERGETGSTYSAALYRGELYVGTNQGIYVYRASPDGRYDDRRFIMGSQGQVWFLQETDGRLYAGLNDGTYILEGDRLRKVSEVNGAYTFKRQPGHDDTHILQSTYSNLVVFGRQGGVWGQDRVIRGFSAPARFLERDHLGALWVGHSIKGLYRLQPTESLDSITVVDTIGVEDGLDEPSNRVFGIENRIVVTTSSRVYQWDALNRRMVPFEELERALGDHTGVLNIVPAGTNRYWVIMRDEAALYEIRFGNVREIMRLAPAMYGLSLVEGYETIVPLNDRIHLICLEDGFALLDLQVIGARDAGTGAPVFRDTRITGSYDYVTLTWSSGRSAGIRPFFQYRLLGYSDTWSEWNSRTSVTFDRLPPGTYTMQVRMLTDAGRVSAVAENAFRISPPWYLSWPAYLFYAVLVVSFGVMIRLYQSRRRWKRRESELREDHDRIRTLKEKVENDLVLLSNQKLQDEIAYKSNQLATSTMAMIRKNELLGKLRQEIEAQKAELGQRLPAKYANRLTRLIDQGLQDELEWEQFEHLYDQAHSDFFKRIKADYPALTPSDLRLCAYLRMNLSSKEIAPLLNITVRGVEERRYRLRKRLNLKTDQNLTELIMTY